MPPKKGIFDLHEMKRRGEQIAWLTAYDYPTASFEEAAGVDMILVGDSLGMCVYGYPGTLPVTMAQCLVHSEAVRRGAPDTFVIGDMPLGSYQASDADAVSNAIRFLKEANVDAVKLEGGVRTLSRVRAILDAGIVVCGHIGLTPQSSGRSAGTRPRAAPSRPPSSSSPTRARSPRPACSCCSSRPCPPRSRASSARELPIPVLGIGAGARHGRPAAHRLRRARHLRRLHPQVREAVRRPRRALDGGARRVRRRRALRRLPRRAALLPHARGRGASASGRGPEARVERRRPAPTRDCS